MSKEKVLDMGNSYESLNRPAWAGVGGFKAYEHKHVGLSDKHPEGIIRDYYVKTVGLVN
jgi:hypothetical protein